jgi:hypothetical protein
MKPEGDGADSPTRASNSLRTRGAHKAVAPRCGSPKNLIKKEKRYHRKKSVIAFYS